jgi:clan AA aspartic protease (TIGR02281 family)
MRLPVRLAVAALLSVAGCAEPRPGSEEACRLDRVGGFSATFAQSIPMVPVQLDGAAATLVFDTGAGWTLVSAAAAERLGLLRNGAIRINTHGIGGQSVSMPGDVGQFGIGGVELPHRMVVVTPFALRGFGTQTPDGVLGLDVIANFDVEADFSTGAVTLYHSRNCPAARPDWLGERGNTLVIPPEVPAGHLQVEVELDGRRMLATLDTGANQIAIDSKSARALGVTDEMLAADHTMADHGAAPEDAQVHVHRFGQLRIGRDVIKAPPIVVVDLPQGAGEMLIGMSYLRNRMWFLSMSSRRVNIGPPPPR